MVGLKSGTVKFLPHNPKWKEVFEKEKKLIQRNLGDLTISIEQVGSTAIPGVLAKPIIDIAIVVKSIKSPDKLIKLLEDLGYEFQKDDDVPGRFFLLKAQKIKEPIIFMLLNRGVKNGKS